LIFGLPLASKIPISKFINALEGKWADTLLATSQHKGGIKTASSVARKLGPVKSLNACHFDGMPLQVNVQVCVM
jgi:hypothetical protein